MASSRRRRPSRIGEALQDGQLERVREIVSGVTDAAAIREIVRRYLYIHDEVKHLQDADHLMKFWRQQEKKERT